MEEEDKIFNGVYPRIKVPWEKPKEDYWALIETKIDKQGHQGKIRRITAWAVAASFLLILSFGLFARFSTTEVKTAYGQHAEVQLPDGSIVSLNAGSEVSYHKWYWAFSRTVKMNGEAFFKVKKGRKFSVISNNGQTHVMGTSFNVYSRDEVYRVACITGKVMVEVPNNEKVFLLPQEKLTARNNNVDVEKNIDKLKELSWINNSFSFNAVPLREVLKEIERQYNVSIEYRGDVGKSYTGVFPKGNLEEVLGIVCRPFGYRYQNISDKRFIITNSNNF